MNLRECFLELVRIEEEGAEIYLKFSEKCDEKIRRVLILFSEQERKHRKALLELSKYERLQDRQLDIHTEQSFMKQINYLNNEETNPITEKEFYKYALQLEKNSAELYENLSAEFEPDTYENKVFRDLMKEEKRHMIFILNRLYQ